MTPGSPDPVEGGSGASPPVLRRELGFTDGVYLGLGSMLGAGVFSAFAPAAAAAGAGLLASLGVAALVAWCNAISSARLALRHPQAGGAYVYGREWLGPWWGFLAGEAFVAGKTASCAAIALTFGTYAFPAHSRTAAVGAVLALTGLNLLGVRRSALVTRGIVLAVLGVLVTVGTLGLAVGPGASSGSDAAPAVASVPGVLRGAGFLFFAFAGYARVATLAEEIRSPARTIPRAITTALVLALAVYALTAAAQLRALGPQGLARSGSPVVAVTAMIGADAGLVPLVRCAAALATLGALLVLLLGVSRTAFAMARAGDLPGMFAALSERHASPDVAQCALAVVVIVVALMVPVPVAIGLSSAAVLVYYAVANAAALRLGKEAGARLAPALGLVGCLALALALPATALAGTTAALAAGFLVRLALAPNPSRH